MSRYCLPRKGTGETWCQLCDFTTSSRKGMIDHIASNHQEVEVRQPGVEKPGIHSYSQYGFLVRWLAYLSSMTASHVTSEGQAGGS